MRNQAQLLPLCSKLCVRERVAMHTVLRAPFNTFRHIDLVDLHVVGGPKLRSFTVASAAALFRAAARTVTSWVQWLGQMNSAAREHSPVAWTQQGYIYPKCWDSPALAQNLQEAFGGFLNNSKYSVAGKLIKDKLAEKNHWVPPAHGDAFFAEFRGLQRFAYDNIMATVFPARSDTSIIYLCKTRLTQMFAPFDLFAESDDEIEKAFETLKPMGQHVVVKVLKTWLHGWATSKRMSEDPVLPCLFGCVGQLDSQRHYVMCPHIFALLRYLIGDIPDDPCIRLAIKVPSQHALKINGF